MRDSEWGPRLCQYLVGINLIGPLGLHVSTVFFFGLRFFFFLNPRLRVIKTHKSNKVDWLDLTITFVIQEIFQVLKEIIKYTRRSYSLYSVVHLSILLTDLQQVNAMACKSKALFHKSS